MHDVKYNGYSNQFCYKLLSVLFSNFSDRALNISVGQEASLMIEVEVNMYSVLSTHTSN